MGSPRGWKPHSTSSGSWLGKDSGQAIRREARGRGVWPPRLSYQCVLGGGPEKRLGSQSPFNIGFGGDQESYGILMLSYRNLEAGCWLESQHPASGSSGGAGRKACTVTSQSTLGAGQGRAGRGRGEDRGVRCLGLRGEGSDTLNTNHLYLCILRLLHLRSTPLHPLRNPLWSPTPTSSWPGGRNVLRWHLPAKTFQTRARKCYHSSHLHHLREETEKRLGEGVSWAWAAAGPGEGGRTRCLRGVLAPVQCPGGLSSVGPGAFRVHGRACPLPEGDLLWPQSCTSQWERLVPQLLVRPLAQKPGSVLGEGRGKWRGQAARLLNLCLCLPSMPANS